MPNCIRSTAASPAARSRRTGCRREPLGPIHLCQALADAAAALGLDAESRLLLLRRIEPPAPDPARVLRRHQRRADRARYPADLKRSYRRQANTSTAAAQATGSETAAGMHRPPPTPSCRRRERDLAPCGGWRASRRQTGLPATLPADATCRRRQSTPPASAMPFLLR